MTIPWAVATSATAVALSTTRSAILRRQPSAMSTAGDKSFSSDAAHLDTIFKQKKALHEAIQRIVLEAPWFKACKGLCAYISSSVLREVDTTRILSHILTSHPEDLQMRKKLFVPRVEDRNRNMRMLNISSTEDLIASSMDILEPAPLDADGNEREDVLFASEPVDLLILPGNYYDTFLSRYQELAEERNWKQPLKIALSYSVQIVDEGTIPLSPNDILVDALVSPSGVIPISPAALEICH
ncbi:hypothetical protein RND71_017658 [Anisodus tanguticus]|uniref:5-formyltetrahydrofolate cyclo-ligase n=1 Tax=Anisodus tanguticus TaxID=243964 RepID=A0AAE1S461_9SOLA|nr:hypothetical protein RND71_017658 [Anisodus tanguticus]